ncbi:uncharacterized protein [Haliotis asinina]|uniref:uncharacterized protein n=1 Tax=Haliotis asinina TaxID=109174 RepID=UPI003531D765
MYKYTESMKNPAYTCAIQSHTLINITALDMRLGDGNDPTRCSLLAITMTPYTCSNVIEPYKQLKTIQSSGLLFITLQVKEGTRPVVWLGITSTRNVSIQCIPTLLVSVTVPTMTASNVTVEKTTENTPTTELITFPKESELSMSNASRFPAGVFMGGVAAGAVIVILVGLTVYVLVIRRRYDLTVKKKQGNTPASAEHPTYSGLSAVDDVNHYDIIEQTSRSQVDTTLGTTATPDYLTPSYSPI